ncbi:tRNA (adenosine(37)-N6)-threonylcarbamoyltransferase complex ATPase subunit type 1 TsaE [candidate division WWE3 bacterium]|nr:tRNA (adenosine(37)-N6)-threonylcarbamoyltransferase complex ATPase subunit type 1 TsaE [candidate division WWE3 bacterium]
MEAIVSSTKATKQLAKKIAEKLKPGDVLALYGDLGSGKTTFTRFLVEALGIKARVQSPTFIIARVYEDDNGAGKENFLRAITKVNHLDLYRLQSKPEVLDLGLLEYFKQPKSITLIEWPELAEDLLPEKTIEIKFEVLAENERKVNVQNLH